MRLVGDVVVMEGGHLHGQTDFGRRVMGVHRAISATAGSAAVPVPRAQAARRSPGPDRDSLRVEDGSSLAGGTLPKGTPSICAFVAWSRFWRDATPPTAAGWESTAGWWSAP